VTSRQITHVISKLKEKGFIKPLEENGRKYYINFVNNYLMRGLIKILEKEGFTPSIDN